LSQGQESEKRVIVFGAVEEYKPLPKKPYEQKEKYR
jgi:hypothetical protein